MQPHNELIGAGNAYCLADPGEAYALYFPLGGEIHIELKAGRTYVCDWWNPSNGKGGSYQDRMILDGGVKSFAAPAEGDWALRIVRQEEEM